MHINITMEQFTLSVSLLNKHKSVNTMWIISRCQDAKITNTSLNNDNILLDWPQQWHHLLQHNRSAHLPVCEIHKSWTVSLHKSIFIYFFLYLFQTKTRLSVQCISPGALNIIIIHPATITPLGGPEEERDSSLKYIFTETEVCLLNMYKNQWIPCRVNVLSCVILCAFHLQFNTLCLKINPGSSASWFTSHRRAWKSPSKRKIKIKKHERKC